MRRTALFALAFVVMAGVALASMVRFTGQRNAEPAPLEQVAASVVEGGAGQLVLPVRGVGMAQVVDTWGQARDGGARPHQGTDIMAPAGTPVVAAAPGVVEKLHESDAGGTTLYIRSSDRRWTYYYAHLAGYAPGLGEGTRVAAGQTIAYVGDTGNAGPGNYHLHFGMTRMRPGDSWWQGEPVDPHPYLAASGARR